MYFCSRQVCFKELKIKLILLNLKHDAKRSHSEACSLKKCTLPYIYFAFKCLMLYFGIKKEWLEKKFEYRDQPWFSVFKHSMDHEEGV